MTTALTEPAAPTLRLVVLQVLAAAARHGVPDVNDAILRSVICELEIGPRPDIVLINQVLNWLAGKGLVALREVSFFRVAALTELGADVGAGRATVDGVLADD